MSEVQRGRLSYDLPPPKPPNEATAEVPMVAGGVAAVGVAMVSFVALWLAMQWVGSRTLIVWTALLLPPAAGAAVTALMARRCRWRIRRNALLVVATIGLVAGFMSSRLEQAARPTHVQLRRELAHLTLPDGVDLVGRTEAGDRFCRRGCSTVAARYAVPTSVDDPRDFVRDALYRDGWANPDPNEDDEVIYRLVKGPYSAEVQLGEDGRSVLVVLSSRTSGGANFRIPGTEGP